MSEQVPTPEVIYVVPAKETSTGKNFLRRLVVALLGVGGIAAVVTLVQKFRAQNDVIVEPPAVHVVPKSENNSN